MLLTVAALKTKADHGMKEYVSPVGGMKDIIRVLERDLLLLGTWHCPV